MELMDPDSFNQICWHLNLCDLAKLFLTCRSFYRKIKETYNSIYNQCTRSLLRIVLRNRNCRHDTDFHYEGYNPRKNVREIRELTAYFVMTNLLNNARIEFDSDIYEMLYELADDDELTHIIDPLELLHKAIVSPQSTHVMYRFALLFPLFQIELSSKPSYTINIAKKILFPK